MPAEFVAELDPNEDQDHQSCEEDKVERLSHTEKLASPNTERRQPCKKEGDTTEQQPDDRVLLLQDTSSQEINDEDERHKGSQCRKEIRGHV